MATETQLNRAFLAGVSSIVDPVQVGLLREAIASGNIQAVIEALDIEDAAFDQLRVLVADTYAQSGADAVGAMTGRLRATRWNSASPRAEAYARDVIGAQIDYITDDMRAGVRAMVADGYAFGRSTNRIALDLVGRVGANGRRQGGTVGLSFQQSQWIANMRQYLAAGDNERVLQYSMRDKRFDRLLKSGRQLTATQIDNITRAYSQRLLLSRGKAIARTERGSAVNNGRAEAYMQAADKLGVGYDRIEKQWRHRPFSREPRLSHIAADKQKVMGINTPFDVGGIAIQWPHAVGLPAGQVVNCNCECKFRIV